MKRLIMIWLLLALLPIAAISEETPRYQAIAGIDFNIRREIGSEYRLKQVKANEGVDVYEYGPEWCRVGDGREIGYCKTSWLWGFRSLNAAEYPVPNAPKIIGMAAVTAPALIAGGKFAGLTVRPGDLLCVLATGAEYTLPVWRDQGALAAENADFLPFIPWETAQPGDLVGGFTTYYNEKTGGSLAANRAYNIALGCERIDGTILAPGASFSFNALCAPYWHSNGYEKAPNISDEGVGYGGGICQLTTTLYNALLGLPLQIDDWAAHQESGVPYIPQYFDAAVGTYSDLVFHNTLPYSLRIAALPQNGALTVLLYRLEE